MATPFATSAAFTIAGGSLARSAALVSGDLVVLYQGFDGPEFAYLSGFELTAAEADPAGFTTGTVLEAGPVSNGDVHVTAALDGGFYTASSGPIDEIRRYDIGLNFTTPLSEAGAAGNVRAVVLAGGNAYAAALSGGTIFYVLLGGSGPSTFSDFAYSDVEVTALQDGGFVITARVPDDGNPSSPPSTTDGDIVNKIINADGSLRATVKLSSISGGNSVIESDPFVFGLENDTGTGGFVSVFTNESGSDGGGAGIFAIRQDRLGNILGFADGDHAGGVGVNTDTAGDQVEATGVGLRDGGFVIAWTDLATGNGDVKAQAFNADGSARGVQFTVAGGTSIQGRAFVSELSDGRLVFTWHEFDGSQYNARARIFDPREAGVTLQGGGLFTTLVGTVFADTLTAGPGGALLMGGRGDDLIIGRGADDDLRGDAGNDRIVGGNGADSLQGGPGHDILEGGNGNDGYVIVDGLDRIVETPSGGDADAVFSTIGVNLNTLGGGFIEVAFAEGTKPIALIGNARANVLDGEGRNPASNALVGGRGNDEYHIDGIDTVTERSGLAGGFDTIISASTSIDLRLAKFGGGNVENATILASDPFSLTGTNSANVLTGNDGDNVILALGGSDKILGGFGRDIMDGGADAVRDTFRFVNVAETGATAGTRDIVRNFGHLEDQLDLKAIDANGVAPGSPLFKFLAVKGAAFTGVRGQLRWTQENPAGTVNDKTIVHGDINGDMIVDFQIELKGLVTLTAADFML